MTNSEIKALKKKLHMIRIALKIRNGKNLGKIYHVKFKNGSWTAKFEGAKRYSIKSSYKDKVVDHAKHLAKGLKFGQVFTYKKDDSPHNAYTYIDTYKREREVAKKRRAAEERRWQRRGWYGYDD